MDYPQIHLAFAFLGSLAVSMVGSLPANAQFRETFEGPETSWKLADRDCTVQVIEHARSFERAHSEQGCEHIQFRADHGTFVHYAHEIPASRLIDEFSAGVWVRANRPGLQLMIRVVLPRSTDPRTGGTLKTLIRGESYQQIDGWQKLSVNCPHQRLVGQLPLLRSQFGPEVSAREAYADLIVLNAYGGSGTTDISIDDLELSGNVSLDTVSRAVASDHKRPTELGSGGSQRPTGNTGVALVGAQLQLEGHPRLPRVIEYQGEPLSWLKSLGFNAVWISRAPNSALLEEAEAAEMWIVATPDPAAMQGGNEERLSRLLAWSLGEDLGATEYESVERAAHKLRSGFSSNDPILICEPSSKIRRYSRIGDVLLLRIPSPSGSMEIGEHGDWYLRRARLARAGTSFWASIDTQVSPRIAHQMSAFGAKFQHPLILDPEQIRLSTFHAIASGARGVLFRSASSLNATDRFTVVRARSLQRLNQQLQLVEPWAATAVHEDEIEVKDSTLRIAVLKTDRSRLVLILRCQPNQQFVAGRSKPRSVAFDIHGVTETDEVYHVAADGLHRIRQQRGTGLQIALETTDIVTPVVLTQDRLVVNYLARKISENRHDEDRLAAEVAAQFYAGVVETHQELLELEPSVGSANESLEQARGQLQHFEQLVEGGGHEQAPIYLNRGMQRLAEARYNIWRSAVDSFLSPVASPLCVSFFSLPDHYRLVGRLRGLAWEPNALAGGDFESLEHLQANQWKHIKQSSIAESDVELSQYSPHSGRSSLRMRCWPRDQWHSSFVLETPPVSIISGPVPVRAGQIVRIHGWTRVPNTIRGSSDGLLIFDSLGGLDLAHRIQKTNGWTEFTMYRAATEAGYLTVTFSLSGFGDVWLDNVTVEAIQRPTGSLAERPHNPPH